VVSVVLSLVVGLSGVGLVAWAGYRFLQENTTGSAAEPAQPPPPSDSGPMPSYPRDLAVYYEQTLDWERCGVYQCTRLTVPLDYAKPAGKTLELAVLRLPASQRSRRIGQLVVDPGGPGASALQYAAAGPLRFGQAVTRYYDLVGMDPRGVGQSSPLHCLDTAGMDRLLGADPSPDDPAEVAQLAAVGKELGAGCEKRSGSLVAHVSTIEAAKDMDVLRAALGERRLDYFGASYGTFLGATYADLFPTHVRRMVLDGAVDPTVSTVDLNLEQVRGFEVALRAYVSDCVSRSGCPLGDDLEGGLAKVRGLIAQTDRAPMDTGTDRPLTTALTQLGLLYPLYLKALWPQLTSALAAAIEKGRGAPMLALADTFTARGSGGFNDNSTEALNAVNCLDHDDAVPLDQVPRYLPEFEKASPTFGAAFAYSTATCASWPVHTGRHGHALHAAGAPPILVIGTTRDPATPYVWARALASQLRSGVLLTRDGDGHTGFMAGNACIDSAVEDYLVAGTPPKDGRTC
jgi:pimeloyl-ACP methyl ester carboxylesterase